MIDAFQIRLMYLGVLLTRNLQLCTRGSIQPRNLVRGYNLTSCRILFGRASFVREISVLYYGTTRRRDADHASVSILNETIEKSQGFADRYGMTAFVSLKNSYRYN